MSTPVITTEMVERAWQWITSADIRDPLDFDRELVRQMLEYAIYGSGQNESRDKPPQDR